MMAMAAFSRETGQHISDQAMDQAMDIDLSPSKISIRKLVDTARRKTTAMTVKNLRRRMTDSH